MDFIQQIFSTPKSSILAIDISHQNIKYLWLKKSRKNLIVENFGKVSFTEDSDTPFEGLTEAVNRLPFNSKRIKNAYVILGITPNRLKVQKISYPKLPQKELDQIILFDLQKELLADGDTGQILSYNQLLGPSPENLDQNEYVIVGAVEEDVSDYVAPFISNGIIPHKVDIQFATFPSLCKDLPSHNGPVGFLDIGDQKSMLAIVQDGYIEYYREVMVGGNDFTKAITGTIFHEGRAIQLMTAEANEFKHKYGYPIGFSEGMTFQGAPLAEVGAMMRPVVERLAGEIHRSIGFFQERGKVEKIQTVYLLGGGSQLKNLPEVLTEKVNLEIKRISVPSSLHFHSNEINRKVFQNKFPEISVAYSLILSADRKGNLLPSIFKKIHTTAAFHQLIKYVILTLLLLIPVVQLQLYIKKNDLGNELVRLRTNVHEAKTKEQMYTSFTNQKQQKQAELNQIESQINSDPKLFQILKMLTNITPNEFALTKIEYVPGSVTAPSNTKGKNNKAGTSAAPSTSQWKMLISGEVENPSQDIRIAVAQFMLEMEKSGYFSDIELVKDVLLGDKSHFSFDLEAQVKD